MHRRSLLPLIAVVVVAACDDRPAGKAGGRVPPPTGVAAVAVAGAGERVTSAHVDSLNDVGAVLYARGAYDSASTVYRDALASATALGDSAAVARTLTSLGLAAWRLADYPESRKTGELALAIKHRLGLRADLFRSYNALGLLAGDAGRTDDALAMFDSALTVARELDSRLDIAKVVSNIARIRTELGQFDMARAGYIAARDAARRAPDLITEWNAVVGLASVENRLANPLGAIAQVDELRRRHPRPDHPVGEDNAFGQLGTAYDLLGETQRAVAAFDSALRIARGASLRAQEAEDLKLLAEIYEQAGDRRRALSLLDEAFAIDSAIGAPDEIADVWLRRASILGAIGDASRARESVARALLIHRRLDARLDILSDLLLDAELAARSHDTTAARDIAEAARLANTIAAPVARRSVAVSMARIADQSGDARRVLWVLDSAKINGALGAVNWEIEALAARAHRRLRQLDLAITHGRRAVEGIERMRKSLGSGALRTALISDRADVYADLVLALLEADRPADALAVADRSRSRALLDHLAVVRTGASDSVSAAGIMAERARLLTRIDALVRQMSAGGGGSIRERGVPPTEESAVAAELAARQRDFDELLVRYPSTSPANLLGDDQMELSALQAALREDEALLEYYVTADRTFAFVVRRRRVAVTSTAIAHDELAARVRLARDLASSPAGLGRDAERSDVAVMRGLYDVLVSPAIASGVLGGVSRLVIVPHGALAYLPFAALRSPSGRFLVEDMSLVYLPMAAGLPALRQAAAVAARVPRPIMAFAPFPRSLVSSPQEVHRAASLTGGSTALTGSSATENALRGALRSGAVVHVASHGVMEIESPMFSRIELARGTGSVSDDGRLEVHELLAMRVASPLVFLSGCETGSGVAWSSRYAHVSDHATLDQAFLYAGATTVVATRWRVEDASAAVLAERFYVHLATHDAGDALALAQRDLIRSPRRRDSQYWAAYAVSGAGTFSLRGLSREVKRPETKSRRIDSTISSAASVSLTSRPRYRP